ncbi:MAG: PilZ domain-containing protein, partial [Gammaproteobacteria bacterium]|nr:PilZ domain-containing protein [Gammaproteobacteria bacterium]
VIATDTDHVSACETRDISMNGIFVITAEKLPEHTLCDISLYLYGTDDEIELRLKGTIVRLESDGMAVEFNQIDIDSFEHLKRIIQLNSVDPDSITDEFEHHLGIKRKPD